MRMRLKDGKKKVLTLSYDDGFVHDKKLVELLNRYGIKGTFNINSGMFLSENEERDKMDGKLKLSESIELYLPSGHEIGAHTVHHTKLDKATKNEILYEIMEDRRLLEEKFNTFVRGFAHPFSVCNEEIKEILKICGYSYARGGESSYNFKLPEDRFCIKPTCRHKDPRLFEFADRFVSEKPRGEDIYLFYVMGHSHEFDSDEKWNIMERFCEKVGGKEDVWYATNIEIFDYIDAYNALKTSAAQKIIYNPSAIPVWVEENSRIYHIPAGQTVEAV